MSANSEVGQRLHDGPIQTLTAAVLQMQTVLRANPELSRENEDVHGAVTSALDLATDAIAELRQLAATALTAPICPTDLLGSLATAGHALTRGTLNLTIEGAPNLDVRGDRAEALYLVGREAVANSVFHANCSRVHIKLDATDDTVTLEVSDDGVGFDPDNVGNGHIGLRLMRDRMAAVGGILDLDVDNGVRVRATVPIAAPVAV